MNVCFAIYTVFLFSVTVSSIPDPDEPVREKGVLRIVGGEPIENDLLPFIVSLHDSGTIYCGGSILNHRYILTSAGCLYNKDVESITVETSYSCSFSLRGNKYRAKALVTHPDFRPELVDYNVGLIKTKISIKFCVRVEPIRLAREEPAEGTSMTIAGWGEIYEGDEEKPRLRFAKVDVIEQRVCEICYEKAMNITDRMFCSWTSGKGACHRDNGGPAVTAAGLVGVISHRFGCGLSMFPDIYAKVSHPSIYRFITSVITL